MEKFSFETNGYNRNEVNQFIKDIIKETEGILTKVKSQNYEIETLKKELQHYKNLENTLNRAIITAEETKANIKKMAHDESVMIINNAKNNASRIVNEALLKAEKVENKAEMLEKNIKIFKRKLKIVMEQQMAVAEEIEVLELEP